MPGVFMASASRAALYSVGYAHYGQLLRFIYSCQSVVLFFPVGGTTLSRRRSARIELVGEFVVLSNSPGGEGEDVGCVSVPCGGRAVFNM